MLEPDFERLYDQRDAYFLDPTGTRVVPDPRLPHQRRRAADGAGPAGARGAVRAARRRACATRWPAPSCAARSPSTEQVGRRRPDRAWPSDPDAGAVARSARSWSGPCAPAAHPHRGDPGRRRAGGHRRRPGGADRSTTGRPSTPTPVPVDAVGHYLSGGALRTVDHGRAGARAGRRRASTGSSSAAVSADAAHRGAVLPRRGSRRRGGRRRCCAGPYGGDLDAGADRRRRSARRPSPPPASEAGWCATAPRSSACRPAARPRRSTRPRWPGWAGPTCCGSRPTACGPPRGRRAGRPRLYVGTVVRARTAAWSCATCAPIAPTLSQVVDVAWRDSGELLVLAGDAGRRPDRALRGRRRRLGAVRRADVRPARPADVDRRGADPAAAGRRRRHRSGSSPAAPG